MLYNWNFTRYCSYCTKIWFTRNQYYNVSIIVRRGDALYDHEAVVGNTYPIGQTAENQDTYIENEIRKLFNLLELSISVSSNRVYVQRNHSLDVKLRTKIPPSSKEELEHLFQSCRHIIYTNEVGQPRPEVYITNASWF